MINYYAAAGHQNEETRRLQGDALLAELGIWGNGRCILCGDFNEHIPDERIVVLLSTQRAWMLPELLDSAGNNCGGTHEVQGIRWLDGFC